MPRRNHRGTTAQLPKPKGGRVKGFWHALAAGVEIIDLSQVEGWNR